jgi:hypothetical protein
MSNFIIKNLPEICSLNFHLNPYTEISEILGLCHYTYIKLGNFKSDDWFLEWNPRWL